jgi:hypothetical protein
LGLGSVAAGLDLLGGFSGVARVAKPLHVADSVRAAGGEVDDVVLY